MFGISIITCTHKEEYMNTIFNNYDRQTHYPKELILVLNNCDTDISKWENEASKYLNVKVFKLEGKRAVGSCMNFAV